MNDEELRIEEEVTEHMEENGFVEGCEADYCDWIDGYIQTQQKLIK